MRPARAEDAVVPPADLPRVSSSRLYNHPESWSHCFLWDQFIIKQVELMAQTLDCSGHHGALPVILDIDKTSIPFAVVSAVARRDLANSLSRETA